MSLTRIDPAPSLVFVRQGKVNTLESIVWHFTEESITLSIDPGYRVPNIVRLIGIRELTIAQGTERTGKELGGRHPITGIHVWTYGHDTFEIVHNEFVHVVRPAPDIGIALGIFWSRWNSHVVIVLFGVDNVLSVDGRH